MNNLVPVFLSLHIGLWTTQTLLDLQMKHILPLSVVPGVASLALISVPSYLTSGVLALLAFPLHRSQAFARGETSLYITYLTSTIIFPILGFQTLMLTAGLYILYKETIRQQINYPLAPIFFLSLTATYLLGFAL